jgi:hypothetical protein
MPPHHTQGLRSKILENTMKAGSPMTKLRIPLGKKDTANGTKNSTGPVGTWKEQNSRLHAQASGDVKIHDSGF